jgi:post-segregation antitoxin (ccd killing protein)
LSSTSSFTIKLPKELKEEMRRLKINWSGYLRQAILRRIGEEEMRRASEALDGVRAKAKSTSTDEIVAWIREDRGR